MRIKFGVADSITGALVVDNLPSFIQARIRARHIEGTFAQCEGAFIPVKYRA